MAGAHASALGINDTAFGLLRDLITDRLGIFYDDNRRDLLADKLAHLTAERGLQSFLDYYYLLKYDEDADRHWRELMNALTVPETYFWRQAEQFRALADVLAPAQLRESDRRLRIWSAACCSGEEPLSVAMALAEAGLLPDPRIEIIASDASPAMLEKARIGVYGERSFRALPAEWRERYFTKVAGGWHVSRDLHHRIDWRVVNLLNEREVASIPPVDIAFCRNVLIYFSDTAIRRVAGLLAQRIKPGGHLFLGAAETFTRWPTDFTLQEVGGAFVYVNRRRDAIPSVERIAS